MAGSDKRSRSIPLELTTIQSAKSTISNWRHKTMMVSGNATHRNYITSGSTYKLEPAAAVGSDEIGADMTNYIESGCAPPPLNDTIMACNHQRQDSNQLAMSIRRQSYSQLSAQHQIETPTQYIQATTSHQDYWPGSAGTAGMGYHHHHQWSTNNDHKLYANHDQNCSAGQQKESQTIDANCSYDPRYQATFTPNNTTTASCSEDSMRLLDSRKSSVNEVVSQHQHQHQHQYQHDDFHEPPQSHQHHHQHSGLAGANNQVYPGYTSVDEYNHQNGHITYPTDLVASYGYHQHHQMPTTTYQDDHSQAFNPIATTTTVPTSEPSAASTSGSFALYQQHHYHQNYSQPSRAATAAANTTNTSRFTFNETADQATAAAAAAANFWASQQYHHDYGRVSSGQPNHNFQHYHSLETSSAQTNSWLDKTAGLRLARHASPSSSSYQGHQQESTYDYYATPSACLSEQAYNDGNEGQHRPPEPAVHCDIVRGPSPSLMMAAYQQIKSTPPPPVTMHATITDTEAQAAQIPERKVPANSGVIKTVETIRAHSSKSVRRSSSSSAFVINQQQQAKKYNESKAKKSAQQSTIVAHNVSNDNIISNNSNPSAPSQSDRLNQCRICGRHYARPSTLKTHLRTHTNERPYKCTVCFKTFSQAANLTAHQRVHTGERPFPCPICGRQFSQSSSVITHLRTHSGERPYRCNMCNRTFSDSSTLTKHCRIHSGEKPYQCDYCPMNFSQSGNLSRHLRLHSIGGLNKTHPTTTNTSTTNTTTNNNKNNTTAMTTAGSGATSSTTATTTAAANQRNHHNSSNLSSSPDSTLSNHSISSRISSRTSRLSSSSSG